MFTSKKNPEYEEITSNFNQKLWGKFDSYGFINFYLWIINRIWDKINPALHLTDVFVLGTFFVEHTVYIQYIMGGLEYIACVWTFILSDSYKLNVWFL